MKLLLSRTALYARVSSERQAQHGTIQSQLAAVREFAASNGMKIDPDLIFADTGVSGTTLARPRLDALRDKAAAGEIDLILILSPDRLARKYAHQLMLVEEFKKLSVEITFVNRQIAASPEDQLLLQIQGVISEYEREKIVERHRRGKLHKAQQGKVCVLSGAPFGYIYIAATETEEARYEIHERESAVVRRVFQMLIEQRLSLSAIARKLTEEQIPTRRDTGHWERSVIWAMLRNPAYIGKAAYLKTQVVERVRPTKLAYDRNFYPKHVHSSTRDRSPEEWITIAVPAIISEELFQQARERLEENKRFSPRNNKRYKYLLSGLLRCQQCGYALYGKPASNSKYRRLYYRCAGQDGYRWKEGRVCTGHPIRVEAMDDLVWEQTRRLLEQPDLVVKEYYRRTQKKQRQRSEFKDILIKKRREIKQQELAKERLLDLYQSGQVSLTEIEQRLKAIRTKMKKAQDECALLEKGEKEEHHRLQVIEQFTDFTQRMKTNLSALSFEERRQIVRLLVEEVLVNTSTDEITVRHILPLDQKFPLCKRSNDSTLRCAALRVTKQLSLHYSCSKKLPDELKQFPILDAMAKDFHHPAVINRIKVRGDVSFYHPEELLMLLSAPEYALDSIHRAAVRTEAERVLAKISLIDWLKNHPQSFLNNPVTNGRDSESSELSIRFRDENSPDWTRFKGL